MLESLGKRDFKLVSFKMIKVGCDQFDITSSTTCFCLKTNRSDRSFAVHKF